MKIKLAILEKDKSYLSRVVTVFGTKYADKIEIYSFSDPDVAMGTLDSAKIDILLASDAFDIDVTRLPKRCAFAYLVDSMGIRALNDQRAICKFQKADLIYKQILSVYSENASRITGFRVDGDKSLIIGFCSPSGGVGTSSMAAACALHFAAQNKKVLYLNLEKFGSADVFFSGQGQFTMRDIILALKSGKTNLPLKLESCVKQDRRGVCFYSSPAVALDMQELSSKETIQLISELKLTGEYDYIVLDLDFSLNKDMLEIYRQVHALILVGNGSAESNTKIQRAYKALSILEHNADAPLMNRMAMIHNAVSSVTGQTLEIPDLRVLGGVPRLDHAATQQVIGKLSQLKLFDNIK